MRCFSALELFDVSLLCEFFLGVEARASEVVFEVLLFFEVLLVAFFQVAEQAEDGGHAGLEAVVVGVNSGERGLGVGEEVGGDGG